MMQLQRQTAHTRFKKLIFVGILLAILLIIIETIDAKKKDYKKKEVGGKSEQEHGSKKDGKFDKFKMAESLKSEKYKKSNSMKEENVSGYKQYSKEGSVIETKNYKVKRGTKYTKKDSETIEEGVNPKITKTFQKVKKYKIVEDSPTEKYFSSKSKGKKTNKKQVEKQETIDEVFQSVKKSHKKDKESDKLDDKFQEEILNQYHNEENVIVEDEMSGSNPRRKKYKLVEVVLEEDGEDDNESNETIIESEIQAEEEMGGVHTTESEEVIEKFKTTHSIKLPKQNKKTSKKDSGLAKEEQVDEKCPMKSEASNSEVDKGFLSSQSESASYEEAEAYESCEPAADTLNRSGPKKLTLYVIEEEVDGVIMKRIVPEEDGVSMCEVADLLQDHYYGGLP